MICVRAKQVAQLFGKLTEQDIVTSFRDDNLRATFHFYNNEKDVGHADPGAARSPGEVSSGSSARLCQYHSPVAEAGMRLTQYHHPIDNVSRGIPA